jgi:hypothetical protein
LLSYRRARFSNPLWQLGLDLSAEGGQDGIAKTGAFSVSWGRMDIKVAEALSLLMMRINSNLNDSVALVRDACSAEDLQWYRRKAGFSRSCQL